MEKKSKKILIAHVIHNICLAGTELNVIKQANVLDRNRFKPIIVSLTDRSGTAEDIIARDIDIYKITKRPGFQREIIANLTNLFRKVRPDIVYSHNWTTFLYSVIAAKLARVPIIIHGEHGRDEAQYQNSRKRIFACQMLSRWCDRITVVSKDIIEIIEKIWDVPGWKIEYMPNGIDLQRFQPASNKNEIRKQLGLPKGKIIIGSIIGNVRPVKDLPTLLKAFCEVRRSRGDIELLLVGQGLDQPDIQQLITELGLSKSVHRWQYRPDVNTIFSALDIYVNSSLYEGMSNTILEAQASAVPVVATRVGGTPTIVRDQYNGLLVNPRDPKSLSQAILRLAENEELRKQLGRQGRQYVEAHHDYQKVIQRFEAFYANLHGDRLNKKPGVPSRVIRTVGRFSKLKEKIPGIIVREKNPIFVFNYHRILPELLASDYLFTPMITTQTVFERQLKFFQQHCHVLSAEEAIHLLKNPDKPRYKHTVLLTFDDGYRDFMQYAVPLLQEFQMPATIFVVTGLIGSKKGVWFDRLAFILNHPKADFRRFGEFFPSLSKQEVEKLAADRLKPEYKLAIRQLIQQLTFQPMDQLEHLMKKLEEESNGLNREMHPIEFLSWDDLKALQQDPLITIGSHGLQHSRLTELPLHALEKEVRSSKEQLERRLGKDIQFFSYPWGAYNARAQKLVKQAGYEAAFALGNRPCYKTGNLYEIERIDAALLQLNGKFDEKFVMGTLTKATFRLRQLKTYLY